jgi:hypothetical protein
MNIDHIYNIFEQIRHMQKKLFLSLQVNGCFFEGWWPVVLESQSHQIWWWYQDVNPIQHFVSHCHIYRLSMAPTGLYYCVKNDRNAGALLTYEKKFKLSQNCAGSRATYAVAQTKRENLIIISSLVYTRTRGWVSRLLSILEPHRWWALRIFFRFSSFHVFFPLKSDNAISFPSPPAVCWLCCPSVRRTVYVRGRAVRRIGTVRACCFTTKTYPAAATRARNTRGDIITYIYLLILCSAWRPIIDNVGAWVAGCVWKTALKWAVNSSVEQSQLALSTSVQKENLSYGYHSHDFSPSVMNFTLLKKRLMKT